MKTKNQDYSLKKGESRTVCQVHIVSSFQTYIWILLILLRFMSVINQFLDLNYLSLIRGQQKNIVVYFRFFLHCGACEFMRLVKVFKHYTGAANNTSATCTICVIITQQQNNTLPTNCTQFTIQSNKQQRQHLFNQLLLSKGETRKHITPEPSLHSQLTLIEICNLTCFFF